MNHPITRVTLALSTLLITLLILKIAGGGGGLTEAAGPSPAVTSAILAQSTAAQIYSGNYYFGDGGQVVQLTESLDTIGIQFVDDIPGSTADSIIASLEMYSAFTAVNPQSTVRAQDVLRTKVLPNAPDAARAAIENALARQEIKQVHRVYRMKSKNQSMLTNYISMVVPKSAEEQTELMLLNEGCVILYKSDYGELGAVGFRFEVPLEEQQHSGETALTRANRYHTLPTVTHAAPVFAPLYQTQHTTLTPTDALFKDEGIPEDPTSTTPGDDVRWHFRQMQMEEAYYEVYGAGWANLDTVDKKVVAVIDNGVFMRYEDFAADSEYPAAIKGFVPSTSDYSVSRASGVVFPSNLHGNPELVDYTGDTSPGSQWFNLGEIGKTPGYDDDQNGQIDDFFGWDFVGSDPYEFDDQDKIPFSDPIDNPAIENYQLRGHGTGASVVIAGLKTDNESTDLPDTVPLNNDSVNGLGTSGGMIGICPSCQIMPIRAHSQSYGNGFIAYDTADVFYAARSEQAILYAAGYKAASGTYSDTRADVLAIMISIESYDPMFHNAIKIARNAGCVLIGSSGNNGVSMDAYPYYPNVWPEVISVGSTQFKDLYDEEQDDPGDPFGPQTWGERRTFSSASFFSNDPSNGSNYGWAIDVFAYSSAYEELRRPKMQTGSQHASENQSHTPYGTVASYSENPGHYTYGPALGVSNAMPQVAGLAALVLTVNPRLSPMDVQVILQTTADDLQYDVNGFRRFRQWATNSFEVTGVELYNEVAADGEDFYTGWGRINAFRAVQKAAQTKSFLRGPSGQGLLSLIPTEYDGAATTRNVVFDGEIVEQASASQISSASDIEFGTVASIDARQRIMYLAGSIVHDSGISGTPSNALFLMRNGEDQPVDAYISDTGDLVVRYEDVYTAADSDKPADYFHRVSDATGLVSAVNTAKAETDGQVHIIELAPGTYILDNTVQFGGKDFVLRSEDPGNMTTVKSTVLQLNPSIGGRVIQFSGAESDKAAVLGLTIKGNYNPNGGANTNSNGGIVGNGTSASISYCYFISNYINGSGAAIEGVYGNIFMNQFGDSPDAVNNWRGNFATIHGGAVANQLWGSLYQNVFWYNEAGYDGGAVHGVHQAIQSNFFLYNTAGRHGGAIAYAKTDNTRESWWQPPNEAPIDYEYSRATIQGNVITENTALTGKGGGLYDCHGSILNNTIYLNQSGVAAHGVANCTRVDQFSTQNNSNVWTPVVAFHNNVIWDNRKVSATNPQGDVQDDPGSQVTKDPYASDEEFSNSAISESVAPNGSNNHGPWEPSGWDTVSYLDFVEETFTPSQPNWGKLLHLESTSPLINQGHPFGDIDPTVDSSAPGNGDYYTIRMFRDVDDQVGPLLLDTNEIPSVYKRDIGADEFSVIDDSDEFVIRWFERF